MKCPICGNEIYEIENCYSDYGYNSYYDHMEGTCSNCGKSWRWIEVFTFDHIEQIEEIKENGHL